MKKEKNKVEKKISTNKTDKIVVTLSLIFVLSIFLSPKAYQITTARYHKFEKEDKINVESAFGKENTEERFRTYFQWYNVIHETGHGVLRFNKSKDFTSAQEEQIVNDFAVAYWLYYGEEDKIELLRDITNYASNNIKTDIKDKDKYLEYADKNWNKKDFFTFNNYGWFQFNSVKNALEREPKLEDVLKEMGLKNIKVPEKKTMKYEVINEETSIDVINDAVDNLHEWNVKFPDAYQKFSDDPNSNLSRPIIDYLGIKKHKKKMNK